ncbi:MAG: macro domain-containing protein [Anaerolineales bacterium]|nr:macro domain-containing protein [Anaerolineales bacterium]
MNTIFRTAALANNGIFQIIQGDLTQQQVGAIVNPANDRLQHGGGLAGLIVRRGGWEIQQASTHWVQTYGPVSHAEPAYTGSGQLPCRYIIHAVGPVWGSGDEDRKLAQAVQGSLRLADQLDLRSLALPAISTGIFGFPKGRAAGVIYATILDYFEHQPESQIEKVLLVLYDQSTLDTFLEIWDLRASS